MATPPTDESGLFRTGELIVDFPRRLAWLRGKPASYTENGFRILEKLSTADAPLKAQDFKMSSNAFGIQVTHLRQQFSERLDDEGAGLRYLPHAQAAGGYTLSKLPTEGSLPTDAVRIWPEASRIFRSGHLAFDTVDETAWFAGRPLSLSPSEAHIVGALISARGNTINPADFGVAPATADSLMNNLRRKLSWELERLGSQMSGKDYIPTVRERGFRLEYFKPELETVFAGSKEELNLSGSLMPATVIRTGDLAIDMSNGAMEFRGRPLMPREDDAAVLKFLAAHIGTLVPNTAFPEAMMQKALGPELNRLRTWLGGRRAGYISTVIGQGIRLNLLPVTDVCRASFDGLDATVEAKYDAQERGRWEQHIAIETIGVEDPKQKSPHNREYSARARQSVYGKSHDANKFTPPER